jgi:hypothetical protein
MFIVKHLIAMLVFVPGISVAQSIMCGLPPLPPLGCHTGPCVCDPYGHCQYLMICG